MYKQLPAPKWDSKRKKWTLSVMIDRKRKQFTSTTPKTAGKREVIDRALEWLGDQDNNSAKRFGDVWISFLNDYVQKRGENEQVIQLRSIGRVFLLPELAECQCGKITIDRWQAVINEARPQRRNKAKLSKKYLNNIKGAIVMFCRWALPRGYISMDPSAQLYVPASAETIGRTILQIEDIERLFSYRVGLWYERALLLEVLTGLRPGEILGLQIDDYHDGLLYIKRAINARGKVTPGKNKNATRCIKLPPQADALVVEQIETIRQLIAYNSEKWLFCNKLGGQPSQAQLRRCWNRLIKAHDLPESSTPYSLRHTFYSHTEAYLPERLIKTVFGHSGKTDSHKLYGDHVVDGEVQEASKRLEVTPLYEAAK